MDKTYIIIAFLGLWVVLFIVFMIINNKRKEKADNFVNENRDKALVHLFCSNTKINGQSISAFQPVTGEYLEKVVALNPGRYTIEGIFETTDTVLTKNVNLRSEMISFDLDLDGGSKYSVGMYLYCPEENEDLRGKPVLSIPLTLVKGSENIKAYVACYKEK